MTTTQIQYWTLKENQRHNVKTEQQTDRDLDIKQGNLVLGRDSLSETSRHNRAVEHYNLLSLSEASRHNKAGEAISRGNLKETTRHNKATEKQASKELKEVTRHNKKSEKFANVQAAASKAQSEAAKQQAKAAQSQAATAAKNASTNAYKARTERYRAETDAKRQAVEALMTEANISRTEAETRLTNKKFDKYDYELLMKGGTVAKNVGAILSGLDSQLPEGVSQSDVKKAKNEYKALSETEKKSKTSMGKFFRNIDKELTYWMLYALGIAPQTEGDWRYIYGTEK